MTDIGHRGPALARIPWWLVLGFGVVSIETVMVGAYFALTSSRILAVRYVIYPFVWINVTLLAAFAVSPRVGNQRHRALGVGIAGAYYLVLLGVAGNVVLGAGTTSGIAGSIIWTTPGWGPVANLVVPGVEGLGLPGFQLHLVPFEVIGYAGLSYLLYANVLDVSRGLLSGALGLVTCVSCSMPLWAPILGFIGGPAAGLVPVATRFTYDIGTAIFLLTAGLLYVAHRSGDGSRMPRFG
ncbi:MAG: hypothetical protein ABEJ27_03610 [Halodesulfurarchaeum sp.]